MARTRKRKRRTTRIDTASEPPVLVQPETRLTRAMAKAALARVEAAATVMPSVIYATREDDSAGDPYFRSAVDREVFDEGSTVGVYDLREVRTQRITHTLVPYEPGGLAVQLPPGTVIGPKRRRRRRRTRVTR